MAKTQAQNDFTYMRREAHDLIFDLATEASGRLEQNDMCPDATSATLVYSDGSRLRILITAERF